MKKYEILFNYEIFLGILWDKTMNDKFIYIQIIGKKVWTLNVNDNESRFNKSF